MLTTDSIPANFEIPTSFGTDMIELVSDVSDRQLKLSATIYTISNDITDGNIYSIPCSTIFIKETEAMLLIREAVKELKPVSKLMLESKQRPVVLQTGKCIDYFNENADSVLLRGERAFLQEHNYTIEDAMYAAIPYPEGLMPNGILFLFFYDEAALNDFMKISDKFLGCVKNYFNV